MNAFWSRCGWATLPKPSSVLIFRFCALLTAVLHDRTARPSSITVQQPHRERPQPNFGPFNPRSSRNTYSSGVLGSVSTTRDLPFTFSEIRAITSSLPQRAEAEPFRPLNQDSESPLPIWVHPPEPNVHPVFPEWKHRCFVKWAPGSRSQREPARSARAVGRSLRTRAVARRGLRPLCDSRRGQGIAGVPAVYRDSLADGEVFEAHRFSPVLNHSLAGDHDHVLVQVRCCAACRGRMPSRALREADRRAARESDYRRCITLFRLQETLSELIIGCTHS